jgi:hypothetical protein
MRIAGPATEETWVGDADGDPVMVITAGAHHPRTGWLGHWLEMWRGGPKDGGRPVATGGDLGLFRNGYGKLRYVLIWPLIQR